VYPLYFAFSAHEKRWPSKTSLETPEK
jgi:hypothetical protein